MLEAERHYDSTHDLRRTIRFGRALVEIVQR
jgi:hypothetical protein